MIREIELSAKPSEAADPLFLQKKLAKTIDVPIEDIYHIEIIRRSVDARRHPVWIRMKVRIYTHEDKPEPWSSPFVFKDVTHSSAVIIAGTGPAGLFAALRLIEGGYKPVLLDRGKQVDERKLDIARLNREHIVNPDSNYCFGEGGAGTFSDGKLYTRSTKRGDVKRILQMMVYHGADINILIDAHPHIGSDKLLPMITGIRETILSCGGEIHFNHRVCDILVTDDSVTAFVDQHGNKFHGKAFVLATGHSARDVYRMFHRKGWPLETKPFAMGVRVEHHQALINSIQYHSKNPDPLLPAASYTLATHVEDRGVYSFCMCPGGIIVPSATEQNQIVVNGMSNSRRNSSFANSGIVTEIKTKDLSGFSQFGPLAGLAFQESAENNMVVGGSDSQKAPAQRLTDFISNTFSQSLPESSYHPGIQSAPLHLLLPGFISGSLSDGFRFFDRKMIGFITEEAVITAIESRTSSPVRIPRCHNNLNYTLFSNLFPCGEGAGYAGGIVSSAMDGNNVAENIINKKM